ncbi:MAG TPA: error-prone DNA polymerase [Chitinophagaceae bacterium]|nr:error-prone DNA polymerase [Chitinophagaceae bacterium]
MRYTELQVTTNFSFLRGASHPHELVKQAADLGYTEIAITDRNTLAGLVRAHAAAREHNIRIIPGCRLDLLDGPSLLAYPINHDGYTQLCELLTTGNLRAEKGECHLYKTDLYKFIRAMKLVVLPPPLNEQLGFDSSFKASVKEYREAFGEHLYIAASRYYQGDDAKYLYRIAQLSEQLQVPMVATNDVHYHEAERRQLQDVLTCIREKCTIYTAGFKLHPNAERHLKPAEEMKRLFARYLAAIERTQEIVQSCQFSLDMLKYEYPEEITTEGHTPQEELTMLTWEGAAKRFPEGIPQKIKNNIQHELEFIERKNYAAYFLTVYDIVRFANEQRILCQGRGSAANSTVCYCLGITAVDPSQIDLLFERFISDARNEPPDIDVDFEHERREEVIQYIYNKYGRDRAAIVATVTQQHHKGAIRDVGKAMGLSIDTINRLANSAWHLGDDPFNDKYLQAQGLNAGDQHLKKVVELTMQFMGFPRQLGQHTGGFVITRGKLTELCPVINARMENRTCIEWNKDDIDALRFLKIDVLSLGMLTCIRKAFDLARDHYGKELTLANIPHGEKPVYDMISKADTIGVFQIESRAQQAMLPRLKPNCFYDLVIEVAIVRPGPIQGDMVHPYLRRRNGEETFKYPSPALRAILERTLGVPLFQEQAMKIAIDAGGFTPDEADQLRRSMATFKLNGVVGKFKEKLISGMIKNGYTPEYADRIFKQLEGFGSYGFPESHAASFALLVYVSAWIKCFYPDIFACALLNSMPMGFYQPAQIIIDARNHGVEVRPADVNHSNWDNKLEEMSGKYCALRLGFRQVKGLRADDMEILINARKNGFFSIRELRDAGVPESALEKLADADAFRSMGLDRRQALWQVAAKNDQPVALFAGQKNEDAAEHSITLPRMSLSEHVVQDYASTSLSLKAHPVSFVREKLSLLHIISTGELINRNHGDMVRVAGLVLVRQRPQTSKGVVFITIEDETGTANLVVFQNMFEYHRKEILQARLLMVEGQLEKKDDVIHVVVQACYNISGLLRELTASRNEDTMPVFPEARNFK